MHILKENKDEKITLLNEEDLLKVAGREVEEETGLKVRVLDDNIYAID